MVRSTPSKAMPCNWTNRSDREKTCPGDDIKTASRSNSVGVNCTAWSPTFTARLLLEQAVAAHGHQARVQGVELRLDASEALPEVDVDADRMAQVLGNLIVNALRHTHQGGQVVLAGRQDGSMVHLVVQDNGQGIPPEVLPRVFDRLYRGDQARPATGGESGLGLAIARSVVELHGGTISVESALGEGAAFMVALPCAKEKARELDASRIKKS